VKPLRVAGMPQVVKMTAVTGTSGAVSTTLTVTP